MRRHRADAAASSVFAVASVPESVFHTPVRVHSYLGRTVPACLALPQLAALATLHPRNAMCRPSSLLGPLAILPSAKLSSAGTAARSPLLHLGRALILH